MTARGARLTGARQGSRKRRQIGALVLGGLLAGLAGTVRARHGAPLGPDLALHRWAIEHRQTGITRAAVALTDTGTGLPAYLIAALAGAVGRRGPWQRLRAGTVAVGALAAGQLVRVALLAAVNRRRPAAADWAARAGGAALPSGHTTSSALVAAIVCLAVLRLTDRPWLRALGCAVALLWAVAIGLTRIYLGVHWPTDVLAGWLLAGCLVLAALSRPRARGRGARTAAAAGTRT